MFQRYLLITVFYLTATISALRAQVWTAQVVDAETNGGITYASIGILGATRGTITDQKGNFSLRFSAAENKDSIRVSAIGYRACTYAIADSLPAIIALRPQPIMAKVVEVKSTALGRLRSSGVTKKSTNVTFFFQSNQLGTELGTIIKLPQSIDKLVKTVNFYLIRNNYGKVKFRVHLYRFDEEMNDLVDIMPRSVFATTEIKSGWVQLDLTDLNILLTGERKVLLSLEWLEDVNPSKSAKDFQFGAVLNPSGTIYFKRAVESDWEYLRKRYYGLRAKLGFYIEWYEL